MLLVIPMSAKERGRGEASPYLEGLRAGGAEAAELLPVAPGEPLPARFDGLLLTGGADVEPARYGEAARAGNLKTDPDRDAMDLALLEQAIEARVPIFALCRGLQLLNVALGGTLYQDLQEDRATTRSHRSAERSALVHDVDLLDPSSRLAGLLLPHLPVNSLHHQAVRIPSSKLRVTARSSGDNIVEALEPDFPYPWLVAVQWHPEELLSDPMQSGLFSAFVASCRKIAVNC